MNLVFSGASVLSSLFSYYFFGGGGRGGGLRPTREAHEADNVCCCPGLLNPHPFLMGVQILLWHPPLPLKPQCPQGSLPDPDPEVSPVGLRVIPLPTWLSSSYWDSRTGFPGCWWQFLAHLLFQNTSQRQPCLSPLGTAASTSRLAEGCGSQGKESCFRFRRGGAGLTPP